MTNIISISLVIGLCYWSGILTVQSVIVVVLALAWHLYDRLDKGNF